MPDDLVTRLRRRADAIADCYDDSYTLLREAADEIEALRKAPYEPPALTRKPVRWKP